MEGRLGPACVVAGNEFGGKLLEWIPGGIEPEPFVVVAHGEIEQGVITNAIEQRQTATGEEGVHDADAVVEIVKKGAVPVPNQMAVTGSVVACRGRHVRAHTMPAR